MLQKLNVILCVFSLLLCNRLSPKLLGLTQQPVIIWRFLWVRTSGVASMRGSGSGSHQVMVRTSAGLQSHEGLAAGRGSTRQMPPSCSRWRDPQLLSTWAPGYVPECPQTWQLTYPRMIQTRGESQMPPYDLVSGVTQHPSCFVLLEAGH